MTALVAIVTRQLDALIPALAIITHRVQIVLMDTNQPIWFKVHRQLTWQSRISVSLQLLNESNTYQDLHSCDSDDFICL